MSLLKLSLVAAIFAALLTIGGHRYVEQGRRHEAERLRAENDRLRLGVSQRQQAQLAKGAPAAVLPANSGLTGTAVPGRPGPNPAASPAEAGRGVDEVYRNEGQATPVATLQTFAWACDAGDAIAVTNLIYFDPTGRAKAVAFMATLPENVRAQWHSPEEMAGALLTSENINHPFPGATILEKARVDPLNSDRVVLELPGLPPAKSRTEYQKVGDTWKYVVTDAMVDNYVARRSASGQP